MAWGDQQPSKQPEGADGGNKSRFAVPPACPRCELTKSQMNRTTQNYQKAYRKKVEGLKQELGTVRADNQHLRSQVRRLRRKRLCHTPSLVLGAGITFLATRLAHILWQQRQKQQQQPTAGEAAAAAEADEAVPGSNGVAAAAGTTVAGL